MLFRFLIFDTLSEAKLSTTEEQLTAQLHKDYLGGNNGYTKMWQAEVHLFIYNWNFGDSSIELQKGWDGTLKAIKPKVAYSYRSFTAKNILC